MGAVYAATHRNHSRAAIKILHPELTANAEVRARFLREGRAANSIGHPRAVKVLDEDQTEDGNLFLVLELLDGESLEARATRKGGKLSVDEVLSATDQILDVLMAAHDKGIIHRDLKPENVFLTRDGDVKVLDFGVARLRELSATTNATSAGMSMGTPAFMAPEQASALWQEVDGRSDLWAVGATMFTLLTGRPVHQGRTPNEILARAVTNLAPPTRSVALDVPVPVAKLIDRALAQNKEDRWTSAHEMQEALRHAYHEIHSAPISSARVLSVPDFVPNRTLPTEVSPAFDSAAVEERTAGRDVTVEPVTSTRSSSIFRTITQAPHLVVGGFFVTAVAVALTVLVGVVLIRTQKGPETAASLDRLPVPGPVSLRASASEPAVQEAQKKPVDETRPEPVAPEPAPTATPKPKPKIAPAPRPAQQHRPKPASALDERKW
jgi:eukaryotic-like serine/threonine-protein kinase